MDYDTRIAGRTEFAEEAEAVGVETDHIMSVLKAPDRQMSFVVYTMTVEINDDTPVYACKLQRDEDGLLQPMSWPRQLATIGSMTSELNKTMEES